MSMFAAFNISASGMTAQQLRTDVISQNIANANTTRTSDGTAYVKKSVVFTEKTERLSFLKTIRVVPESKKQNIWRKK